ncbi:MAG: DUF11 domain-containing protein, partial [Acidimicrobiia bacterium]|nr:DUF11 domain-containing protein [Acidimicrobiia bacterium]
MTAMSGWLNSPSPLSKAMAIAAFLIASSAAALPIPRPSSFYGTVTVEGNPVGAGLALTAEIGGTQFAATTTFEFAGLTVYRIDVPADDPATAPVEGGSEGQVVDFLLDGVPVTEAGTWSDGTYTNLDLTIPPGADLSIAKDDGVTEANPGDTLTYTLTVSNQNAVDAFGIVLEDPLPVGTSFVSASDGGSEAGGVVSWPAFDLAGGATATRTLVLQVANSFPAGTGEIVNTATVQSDGSDGFDPNPADNTATDADRLNGGPDLAVTKSADLTEVRPGETITYTIEVTNNGFQDAVDVRLTDVLPPNVTFQTATGEGAILGSIVQWPVFDVALGATVTRTYRVRLDLLVPPGFSQLVNTATATEANNLELDPSDNTTFLTLPILEAPDLTVLFVDISGAPVDPQGLTIAGQVAVELANVGNLDVFGAFDVAIFEDLNGNGSFEPGTDNLLGTAPLGSGLSAQDILTVDVPVAGNVLFRNSPLYAFVDSGEAIDEHSEANNIDTAASACAAIPTPGDFAPVTEIAWPVPGTSDSFSRDSASVPLVVQLTDDNGDGVRDENDIPDIVFVSIDLSFPFNPAPRLRAIRGDTGAELWSAPQISAFWVYALTGATAGDIDLDGRPEIIVSMISTQTNTGSTNRLAAYEHNGVFKWFSSIYNTHPNGTSLTNRDNPSIADLDQDGVPEIIVGANVFNNNGSFKWIGAAGQGYQSARNADANDSGAISIAADLNLSGGLELVTGNTAYNADGSIQWQIPFDDGYPSIGNFDADPFPEIVVVSRGNVRLHEHDGTLIWGPIPLPGDNPEAGGAATVGDFDGDGAPEIGVAGSTQYTLFESDGSIKWQQTIQDGSSNMTGSTLFDFDADGLAEVVYRDEVFLRIFRGIDGTVLFQTAIGSFTANEEAVVADVDNDGNAEIIISSNQSGTRGLRVLGDSNDNWAAARGVWNQHQYHIDNIND